MTFVLVLTVLSTITFLSAERIAPGRALPPAPGWYSRALGMTAVQIAITFAWSRTWPRLFGHVSLLHLAALNTPALEGFVAWLVGTFAFYWWHRARHAKGLWQVFHQLHHSPSRIETLTAFYKHPVEIAADTALSSTIIYGVLGCSIPAAFWYSFFAATGEYFYHVNLRTPRWLRYVIQTPELHSIHHEYDSHSFNYGDIPLWDRMLGTYRDALHFVPRCGFPDGAESRLTAMLIFKDVYDSDASRDDQ